MTDIIAEIDDVITWYGSADAMTWKADGELPRSEPTYVELGRTGSRTTTYPKVVRICVPKPAELSFEIDGTIPPVIEHAYFRVVCTYSFMRDAWHLDRPGHMSMAINADILEYRFAGSLERAVMAMVREQDEEER